MLNFRFVAVLLSALVSGAAFSATELIWVYTCTTYDASAGWSGCAYRQVALIPPDVPDRLTLVEATVSDMSGDQVFIDWLKGNVTVLQNVVNTTVASATVTPMDETEAKKLWLSGMFIVISLYLTALGIGKALRLFKPR